MRVSKQSVLDLFRASFDSKKSVKNLKNRGQVGDQYGQGLSFQHLIIVQPGGGRLHPNQIIQTSRDIKFR